VPVRGCSIVIDEATCHDEVACHPGGQVLGQRQQLGTSIGIQFIPGDIVGQERIIVDRARALTVLRRTPGLTGTPL
jgi:hypothetical protein